MATVVDMNNRRDRQALERLNRVTGRDFGRWPRSLLGGSDEKETPAETPASLAGLRPTGENR
jgi:hypothetical protein